MKSILALFLILGLAYCSQDYKTYYFDQKVNHEGFEMSDLTFKQKYLVKDDFYKYDKGPILFYCGNEGPIEMFYNNTGFMTHTLAKEFNGLVVFMEHRYFGESWPFGDEKESLKKGNNKFLTSL